MVLVIHLFIFTQLTLIMISDAGGDETVQKMRFGRMIFYAIGFGIGVIGVLILFVIVFVYILVFGISSLSDIYADRMIGFGIFGTIIFIFSLWGIAKEEQYGTEGEMKGSASFWANFMIFFLSFFVVCGGVVHTLDYFVFNQYALQIHPDLNYIVGISYLPIGSIVLLLSIIKLRRDYRYRQQFY